MQTLLIFWGNNIDIGKGDFDRSVLQFTYGIYFGKLMYTLSKFTMYVSERNPGNEPVQPRECGEILHVVCCTRRTVGGHGTLLRWFVRIQLYSYFHCQN